MDKNMSTFVERGESYEECVSRIRAKYGKNYYILNKRAVSSGGFLGLFKKDCMEVLYTVQSPASSPYRPASEAAAGAGFSGSAAVPDKGFDEEKARIIANAKKLASDPQMTAIQKQLETLNRKLDTISVDTESEPSIRKIEELLESNEFSASYIRNMSARLRSEFSLEQLSDFDAVQAKVAEWIGEGIRLRLDDGFKRRPKVLILVGPTGVGKTTTVAKLAAQYRFQKGDNDERLSIRMVTIDRFRIAAQEQLAKYGEHMDIPTTAAESADDIRDILAIHSGKLDVMLIDTIGYSPHDYESIGRMRKILDVPGLKPEVYLTVSAATKASDLRDIMRNYETFDYKAVIVTKYDETNHIGNVLSVLAEKDKPVAYISTGQKVPRDIERASVVKFMLKLTDFKIDREALERAFPVRQETDGSYPAGTVSENRTETKHGSI
ncbi:flagellar biosynthesis protein FlhF [Treponema brennaborense]|nr:flagellar biosynthesis protein FlhF [Treponema brennaborense]